MIRILERGNKKPVTKTVTYAVWETKCGRCGCVFEAEKEDFRQECGLDIVTCPRCGWYLDSYRWDYSIKKERKKTVKEWED